MRSTSRILAIFFLLSAHLRVLQAASAATSFCKCTCFSNSTIIPLDAPRAKPQPSIGPRSIDLDLPSNADSQLWRQPQSQPQPQPREERDHSDISVGEGRKQHKRRKEDDRKEFRAGNCNDCNRQYCIDAHLPICKGAEVKDVFTTCFQRDSRKDQAVVFIFIVATAGLLTWAAVKPWVGGWIERARERGPYMPVPNQGDVT